MVGIFVYTTVVVTQGHFSGLAGALALAIVMLPVVTVSAEEILRLTPRPIAEGARALGLVSMALHPVRLRPDRAVRAS